MRRTLLSWCFGVGFLAASTAWTPEAAAYPWMVKHGYTSCATCHEDPSGGGLPTAYGRAQGSLLMTSRLGWTDDEAFARAGELFFGAVHLPEEVSFGGDVRGMGLVTSVGGQSGQTMDEKLILMQADLEAGVHVSSLRAGGSVGLATDGAYAATVIDGEDARLVSRTHWLGVELGADRAFLLRAGRINVPFGIRTLEHTSWVRVSTRTDINAAQQHGVALAYTGQTLRGEAMFMAGNYQIRPDAARERGYSAYVEVILSEHLAIGASSLIAHADNDVQLRSPLWRHAHGAFVRGAPLPWLSLLAETDLLYDSQPGYNAAGVAGWAQADAEPVQGLHFLLTFEAQDRDVDTLGLSLAGWAGVAWFFAPHADVRVDGVVQTIAVPGARVGAESLLAQLHFYL